jgi:hypothetical protein
VDTSVGWRLDAAAAVAAGAAALDTAVRQTVVALGCTPAARRNPRRNPRERGEDWREGAAVRKPRSPHLPRRDWSCRTRRLVAEACS